MFTLAIMFGILYPKAFLPERTRQLFPDILSTTHNRAIHNGASYNSVKAGTAQGTAGIKW